VADIAKAITPSLCTIDPPPPFQRTLEAATDMAAGDIVYIASTGKFTLTDGTALDAKANWWGMINRACKAGQFVTAYHGVEFRYGSGLTIAARYYLSATVGQLADAATTGGNVPTAFATGTDTIFVISPNR
jgi:hypothetical protein